MRLALDAMGNDRGAPPLLAGTLRYVSQHPEDTVLLVGDPDKLDPLLADWPAAARGRIEIVAARQVIEMGEKVSALRQKRDSSVVRLVETVVEGRAEAMIALGNTAAAVGAATIGMRMLPGVRRAGIAVPMPTRLGTPCVVIDMGANTAAQPAHLACYGVMASAYAERVLKRPNPRVGLLNVGEERGKGNDDLREAFALLEASPLNFVGNVEGGDIFRGECDVVVCEGFVGNVVLKAAEEMVGAMSSWMREAFTSSWVAKIGALLTRSALMKVRQKVDYAAYGGASLLGVKGICVIGHGRSSPDAVYNALRFARESVRQEINKNISEAMAALAGTVPTSLPAAGDSAVVAEG